MVNNSIAARLKYYIEELGLTSSQFADMCNIPRPTLSQLLTGRNKKVSNMLINQIHNFFPDLSILWLMFGEGEMKNSLVNIPDTNYNQVFQTVENGIFRADIRNDENNWKDNGLKTDVTTVQNAEQKRFESNMQILELKKHIDELKKNPRKVVQITVYYDDSTFETFIPS